MTLPFKEEPLCGMDVDDAVKELGSPAEPGGSEDILGSKQKASHNFPESLVAIWDDLLRESPVVLSFAGG